MGINNKSDFGAAFLFARKAKGLTQEAFDDVSSRVYVSALERRKKQPTLPKVDELAERMGLHPLVLLTLSYCSSMNRQELDSLMKVLKQQLDGLISD